MNSSRVIRAGVLMLLGSAIGSRVVLAQTEIELQRLHDRQRLAAEQRLLKSHPVNFATRNTIRVTKNRAYFNIGIPPVPTPLAKADRPGYYVWRWNVDGIIPFSIVLAADSAMRTGDVDDILKGSRVRKCANVAETSAQACTDSVEAVVQQWVKLVRIEVKDTAIFNIIRNTRPQVARLILYEPTGRAHSWAVKIRYEGLPLVVPRR